MPIISIIIPVYNVERYLEKCLDSVFESLDGVSGEVLVINNNSTDSSLSILKKYAKKYPKVITLLNNPVQGLSETRNYGTTMAKGKYIWFVDSDDSIAQDAVKLLTQKAEKTGADLVMMGAERVYPDGHKDYLSPVSPDEVGYKSRFVRYGMGAWQVLIRREWWNKHHFAFFEGHIHEDMELMSSLILYTDKYSCIDKPLYFYSQNDNSILHKTKYNPNIFDIFPALESLYNRFKTAGAEQRYHDELEWFFIWNLLIDSAKDFGQFPEGQPGFQRSREMLKKYFPEWRKNRFLREKPLKLQIRVSLNYKK